MISLCMLVLALGCVPALLPLKLLSRLRRKVGHRLAMVCVIALAVVSYGAAIWLGTGRVLAMILPALALIAANVVSEVTTLVSRSVAKEAIKPEPKVQGCLKRASKRAWFIRVAIVVTMIAEILSIIVTGQHAIGLQLVFVAALLFSAVLVALMRAWRARVSDKLHEAELLRYLIWAHDQNIKTVVHVPTSTPANLEMLDLLMAELKARDISVGLLCRGRKTFAAVSQVWPQSWLIRTTQDLDAYAVSPIKKCFHLAMGTTNGHLVSVRALHHIFVDIKGTVLKGDMIAKDLRMYDEIWVKGEPSLGLLADANNYAITVKSLDAKPVFLPSVPRLPKKTVALIVPNGAGKDTDLTYFGDIVPSLDAVLDEGNINLVVAFMGGPNTANAKGMHRALCASLGDDHVFIADDMVSALNRAPYVFDGPWSQRYPAYAARRIVISVAISRNPAGAGQ